MINLIANVVWYRNKLVIGRNNDLLIKLKQDMSHFKNITTNTDNNSKFKKNIVVMGKNTWNSIPESYRPLHNRINFVITSDKKLHNFRNLDNKDDNNVYFMSIQTFEKFYKHWNPTVFIIGGGKLYNYFLNHNDQTLTPNRIYLTQITNYKFDKTIGDLTYMEPISCNYKLVSISQKYTYTSNESNKSLNYYFLMYSKTNTNTNKNYTTDTTDDKYLSLCRNVIANGKERPDRTGVGTISTFGQQVIYDISHSLPLLTTKSVPWKHVIEELLWFMRGDTDAKILQDRGLKIWDGNTSREFLDSRGLNYYKEGVLGPGYGWQWRFFGSYYSQSYSDTSKLKLDTILQLKSTGFDQLEYIENLLKTDPFSRRILMSYWNPPDFHKTALLPCHYSCQFYVEEVNNKRILNCHFTMRSNDLFLGHPFNISSYAILTYILALRCNMEPGKLVYTGGDVHIYKNHIDQMNKQLTREPRAEPVLLIDQSIKWKNYNEITINDFDIVGYFPHPMIKADMAI
jgi:dihydrofolate reductase / thymidylate synthase